MSCALITLVVLCALILFFLIGGTQSINRSFLVSCIDSFSPALVHFSCINIFLAKCLHTGLETTSKIKYVFILTKFLSFILRVTNNHNCTLNNDHIITLMPVSCKILAKYAIINLWLRQLISSIFRFNTFQKFSGPLFNEYESLLHDN